MRESFQDDLQGLSDLLVDMTRLVASAVNRATFALLHSDLPTAEGVISADQQIDALHAELEERALSLLALQQPVATDLRAIVTGLRMSSDLERMGDLARHVAKLARMRHPRAAIPAEVHGTVLQMGTLAEQLVIKVGAVIGQRDAALAGELEVDDDVMDDLHRQLFALLLDEDWSHGIEAAIDVTLCGRYYERFADHAVSVARRVIFLVTGERALSS